MPRGRHRHSPPLHRLLPPSAIAGVSLVCAVGPWLFTEPGVLRMLAAGAAVTAVAGAVVMRSWDTAAGKRVADLTRARASDEWRHEERVAELETDLDESRELRTKLELNLRAKRVELAGLRNEHAALLRRYATAETERASALEGRRLLEIETTAPARELPAAREPAQSVDAAEPETAEAVDSTETPEDVAGTGEETNADAGEGTDAEATAETAETADKGVSEKEAGAESEAGASDVSEAAEAFSPAGSSLFLRADAALSRIAGGAAEADVPDGDGDTGSTDTGTASDSAPATDGEGTADGDAHGDAHGDADTATEPAADSDPEPDPDPEAESVPEDDDPGAFAGAEPGDSPAQGSAHDAPAAPASALSLLDEQRARADATDVAPSAPGAEDETDGTRPATTPEAADEHERTDTVPAPTQAPAPTPTPAPAPTPAHAKASSAADEVAHPAQPVKPAKPVRPSGHFTVPTAVAVVPTTPARRPSVEGGFDFFGTQQGASSDAMESVQNEDLADVVGQEALALHKAEAEAGFKPADEESRGVGQVIDLTAHDETEHIDVGVLRSAVS
ncbi:hypothetical protein ACIOTI_19420 [Streptomyces sp. NPDC087843]|uniref:hypothetical protein n=1 Tax=Streptomyces sp. NPDC087843 TaxID=3365804 RepID=UPI0037F2F8C2